MGRAMSNARQLRVASVTLSHVFGVPHELQLPFTRTSGAWPPSVLIFGENGSGKSSIVKAIEWAVQDRVQRKTLNRETPRPTLLNIFSPAEQGLAAVTLSDSTVLLREAVWDQSGSVFTFSGTDTPQAFQRSPIALTRADILAFINSAPKDRGAIFLDCSLGGSTLPRSESSELARTPHRLAELKAALGDIDDWLTKAFREITRSRHFAEIHARLGETSPTALEIEVQTSDGAAYPDLLFSERYQDLVAILFYLAIARAAAQQGQAQVLILDDVLQSVDAQIRIALMQFVLREFKPWQLIITIHDRLWWEELRGLFSDTGQAIVHIELRDWTSSSGPQVKQPNFDPGATLRNVLPVADPGPVCALAGPLLEQISNVLSWTLPIRVQRKRDDRYTLDDLWPGVAKSLKRSEAAACIKEIDGLRRLRNLAGAHYNEWAKTVTSGEAQRFAAGVLELLARTWCSKCTSWVRRTDHTLVCPCGSVQLDPLAK